MVGDMVMGRVVVGLGRLGDVVLAVSGGWDGGGCAGGLRAQISLLSRFCLARMHTRHGSR